MIESLLLLLFAVAAIGVFLFTGMEVATLAVNRVTLSERLREAGEDPSDAFALISDTQRSLAAALVGVNVCALIGAFALHTLFRALLHRFAPPLPVPGCALALTILAASPIYLMVTDVLARPLVRRRATDFLIHTREPLRWCAGLMAPLLHGCTSVAGWVLRPFGIDKAVAMRPMTVNEIIQMIGETESGGGDEVSERDMIHGAIDLEASNVREVMRPLVDVIATQIPESTVATVLELARQTGYSRYPVFRQRIIEMTEYVDVTRMLMDGRADGPLAPYLSVALIVPETMRIGILLRTLTERREQCAIVVDEFGGVVGWVTREDVLEEIVGDIADKDADEDPGWSRDEAGVYHVEARIDLDDLNEEIGAQFVKGDEFDTLGGWLYTWIGRIPHVGEWVEADEARVTVEEMDAHRVVRATVERFESPGGERK